MKAAFISALALASSACAAPLQKRYDSLNDFVILQYALTLEHLEDTFYRQGLSNFSASDFTDAGFDSSVRERISTISSDETTHVAFLTTALTSLNQTPVAACEYAFGVTDPKSFLATASLLEGVGVSAYLGAAAYIMDKTYLTAAGAILTVESRHSAYIRNTIGETPFPAPFDVPLDFDQVYSLASLFITSCPSSNPALPVKAFPVLSASAATAKSGSQIKLTPAKSVKLSGSVYAAWIGYPANAYGVYNPATGMVEVPEGFAGQIAVVLTSSMNVTDDTVLAGPALVEITA